MRSYLRFSLDHGYVAFLQALGWAGFLAIHARLYRAHGPDYGRTWRLVHVHRSPAGVMFTFASDPAQSEGTVHTDSRGMIN